MELSRSIESRVRRAWANPRPPMARAENAQSLVRHLQRSIGNQAIQRLSNRGASIARLSAPDLGSGSRPGTDSIHVQRAVYDPKAKTYLDSRNLPPNLSAVLRTLMLSTDRFFLPDDQTPDFSDDKPRVLRDKKYLLGEEHGDGTFATRTRPWSYIPKMSEAVKGFSGESPQLTAAIEQSKIVDTSYAMPLDSYHSYLLTRVLILQSLLNDHKSLALERLPDVEPLPLDIVLSLGESKEKGEAPPTRDLKKINEEERKAEASAHSMFGDQVVELVKGLADYLEITQHLKPKDERDLYLWEIYKTIRTDDGPTSNFKLLRELAAFYRPRSGSSVTPRDPATLKEGEIGNLQEMLRTIARNLLELIDKRPQGFFFGRKGKDTVPRRQDIDRLSKPGKDANLAEALALGDAVREPAMIDAILVAKPPLFVQVGNNHLDSLIKALGNDVVGVPKAEDFAAMCVIDRIS